MRILILGGYGLIGAYVTARLLQAGSEVTGLARSMVEARRFPRVSWHQGDLAQMTASGDWTPLLDGVDAVVNCAGALQEGPRDALRGVHVAGPLALYAACAAHGIRRIVHISATGIDGADTAFARTKREAEKALMATGLDWVILRPGLVLAPGAYGGTALIRGLAGFPLVTPIVAADRIVQVVSVHDVAETVVRSLARDAPRRVTWELMHPAKTTLGDIVTGYRAWLGFAPRPLLRVPALLARASSWCADALAYLGWRSPLRTTSLKQLAAGVTGDPAGWIAATAIRPRSLADIFIEPPSSVQERWFARLYFIKPLGLALLSVFWIYSGAVALGPGFASATQLLHEAGLNASVARAAVIGGALADIVLGLGVAVRRTAKAALTGMIAVCCGYLIAGTVLLPTLWLDPLGAFAKIVPVIIAALALRAIMDER